MRKFLLALVLLIGGGDLVAQRLTFCLDHSRSGEPLAPGHDFELDQFGQEVDFLLEGTGEMPLGKYFVFIDKQVDDRFQEYDTKSLQRDSASTWMSLAYRFERSGAYRVSILNAERQLVTQDTLKVNVLRDVGGPSYYRDAAVSFAFEIQDGEPDAELERVTLSSLRKRPLRVLIRHYRPLRTRRLVVDVWRDRDVPEYVESIEYEVEPHWMFTQFEYNFREADTYLFRVYSGSEVWIGTGKIRVEQ